ncbi:glycoside hydrolase family 9 protein [Cellvibrio sp. ARAG 10.3]|uniref:glycoside hydrolase family 9 protein n=1 Tax=Cellvibrio sp. ARAG 10.3 TaxID=3451358 RepID=UPI003F460935
MNISRVALLMLISGLISACGGGGNSPDPTPTPSSSSSSVANSSEASSSQNSSSSVAIPTTVSSFIVVDQFGYLPTAEKIAVVRDPHTGYDAAESFTPGATYRLINTDTGEVVHSGTVQTWNGGATHTASGDKVWWFNFSSVTAQGNYVVVDVENNVRSPAFKINAGVYKPVLKHAVRTFFYQRAGTPKQEPYAEAGWTDAASHIGAGQDKNARLYNDTGNAATERDLSGGWYDAGDYNKYTNWHADYLIVLLHTYLENPAVWTDDFNIPESGNGIPDLIDEIKWGFDWLIKMQEDNGSVLSVMGLSHASPPSSATGPSLYGPASTSATLTSASAFAMGSKVLASLGIASLNTYAEDLGNRAEEAWNWANANPNVTFYNNASESGSLGLAAGQQEVDDAGRAAKKLAAAIYLFAATGNTSYRDFVDTQYNAAPIDWVSPWNEPQLTNFLYYASLPDATATVANNIKTNYAAAMNTGENWSAVRNNVDAYRAFLGDSNFTWGSNRTMSRKGTTFYNLLSFDLGEVDETEVRNAALGYINYIHGVNPQAMAYLSNMGSVGAHSSVNEFYHSWFADGSDLWDRVGESEYGPAPGFLVGGPNPSYDWDGNCTSPNPNPGCGAAAPTPPRGQPPMKSYLDFNTSWPLNSWQITENHNDYQVAYIRLLSKFVQ